MNHTVLIAAIGLLSTTTIFAQTVSGPLIVVEDRGGDSALPYYQSLNPQPDQATPPAPMPAPRVGNAADAEAAMLPVRSTQLSPGEDWLLAIGRYHRPVGGAPAARYRRSVHRHLTRVLDPDVPVPTLQATTP